MSKTLALRGILCALFLFFVSCHVMADDFKPVNPAELALKDNPKAPGAHAMILDKSDIEDDANDFSDHYYRIKIFTDEGKKYADIEIPYVKGDFNVSGIKARTIRPDGTVVPFTGQVYDKLVVKGRGIKFQAKTFTMPDVQPGSIIEYKYKKSWGNVLYSTYWTLQDELYIKHALYTLKPYSDGQWGFRYMGVGVQGTKIQEKNGNYSLELNEVPAFEEERNAPPARELKPRFEFFYTLANQESDKDKFWKKAGQEYYRSIEDFIGHRGFIQSSAATMFAPGDSNEVKLRKIYEKVQALRNLSFVHEMTEQEIKREKFKDINNVEDVLKRGYGFHYQLNRLYAALVRAAGMDAQVIKVSERNEVFFRKDLFDTRQLEGEVVVVKADGKDYFLDPGTPMCPFNEMPWKMTGVIAFQVAKDGGQFIQTPNLQSNGAVTHRVANLKFADGGFKGTVEVTFAKQDALVWRLSEFTSDEAELKTDLEDDLKRLLPGGSTIKLTGIQNAKDENQPLVVNYDVEMPFTGSLVGSRMLVPMEVFQSNNRNPFVHEQRAHPIYFSYPFQEIDEVNIDMGKGMSIENLPAAKQNQTDFAYYDAHWGNNGSQLQLIRRFAMLGVLMPKTLYPQMRTFYEQMNAADQESVVLRGQKTASK